MAEGSSDESDGEDNAEFLAEHEKYLEDAEIRNAQLLQKEEERQAVITPLKSESC
jgi:hypothetical protein